MDNFKETHRKYRGDKSVPVGEDLSPFVTCFDPLGDSLSPLGDYPSPLRDRYKYLGDDASPQGENDKYLGDRLSPHEDNDFPQTQKQQIPLSEDLLFN